MGGGGEGGSASRGDTALPLLDFDPAPFTSDFRLQKYKNISFCCLSDQGCGCLSVCHQPQETKSAPGSNRTEQEVRRTSSGDRSPAPWASVKADLPSWLCKVRCVQAPELAMETEVPGDPRQKPGSISQSFNKRLLTTADKDAGFPPWGLPSAAGRFSQTGTKLEPYSCPSSLYHFS